MSLSTVQIWQASPGARHRFARPIADNGQARSSNRRGVAGLDNPQLLLAQLVKLGRLTPFQANAFLANDTQTLTIGRHRLLAQLNSPP